MYSLIGGAGATYTQISITFKSIFKNPWKYPHIKTVFL